MQPVGVQVHGFREIRSTVFPEQSGRHSSGENLKIQTRRIVLGSASCSKLITGRLVPLLCRVDVKSCSAMNESVQVVVCLKVDRVLDKKRLEIPDLMVCNVLEFVSTTSPQLHCTQPTSFIDSRIPSSSHKPLTMLSGLFCETPVRV